MSRRMYLAASLVLLFAQATFAQTARFQQVYENTVKPGQEAVYENYIKKLVAGYDKVGAKVYWTTYSVMLGKPGGTYRVALNFNSWADREAWGTIPATLTKAYGQQEAERLMREGGNALERSVAEVWENLPGASANQGGTQGNFVRSRIVRVQPERAGEYEALSAKFKPAYDGASNKPVIGLSVLRVGANSTYTYRRVQQVNKLSDLDAPAGADLLQTFFGAQWDAMNAALNKMVTFRQDFVATRRPELSRAVPATTGSR